ncbi:MAG: histidine kinase [Bacteroidota bacterium]|nr:histidine kinase [Bacteroidota bacterium]
MKFERKHKNIYRMMAGELILLAICGLIGVVASTIFSRGIYWGNIDIQIFYGMLVGYPLFKGNYFWGDFMTRTFPWRKGPLRTLLICFASGIVISMIIIVLVNLLWYNLRSKEPVSLAVLFDQGFFVMISELIITIIITLGHYMANFFVEWKKLLIQEEQFKREALNLQFNALKNQVNPHFLFNSLNVLTSLVETDPPLAVKFIKQLSEVYRYVLEHKDKELIELSTELQFVNAFVYLQKIRFDHSLVVDITLDDVAGRIIPLSLQMLVENAIKHNIISEDKPLNISITAEEGYLVVNNNLQKKKVIHETGSIGLDNIRNRYAYFTGLPVVVEETNDRFTVKLPLIEIQS